MAIERNPVPGAKIPPPLRCIDLDPTTGTVVGSECASLRAAHEAKWKAAGKTKKFDCPNKKKGNGKCSGRTFLYPRKWANESGFFHFHQGIDLFAEHGTEI